MSAEAIPDGEEYGEQPYPAVPGDGCRPGADADWDADADLARVIAAVEAGEIQIPPDGDPVPGAWFSVAGVADPAEIDLAGLAQGGLLNAMPPDAVLAAVTAGACDPEVLAALTDDQVLGLAAAGRRLAGRAAWVQQTAVAEFAARRREPDRKKASPLGFTPFAADELVPELVVTTTAAELAMANADSVTRRLPACRGLLRDGLISEYQLKIITEYTDCLSPEGAAEADLLLAAAAPGLTPSQLRAMCAKTVMMIDPEAAQHRKETSAKDARIVRFQEYSGNAALCGRDLPPDEVLAASAHIDACARELRAAGLEGTLQQLRVRVYLDLTQGLDPLARLVPPPSDARTASLDSDTDQPADRDEDQPADCGEPAHLGARDDGARDDGARDDGARDDGARDDGARDDGARDDGARDDDAHDDGHRYDSYHGDSHHGDSHHDDSQSDGDDPAGEDTDDTGPGSPDGPLPGGPPEPKGSTVAASPGSKPPVKAVINLLVPAGTLYGWSTAPGEIPGFGLLDPQTTRDMTEAAAAHPDTRWCVTVVGPDGTAAAHGCAPGSHAWTPDPGSPSHTSQNEGRNRDGPGPPPGPAAQAAQVQDLLRRLRVRLAPIAKGTCDHRHHSDRYVVSRKVKDLIKARASKCTAPGCNRPAAEADADHTIPWPDGPTCECNLGAPCRYHHRNKQAPGWHLEQPEPGVMKWRNPSGRTHTTYPTKYLI